MEKGFAILAALFVGVPLFLLSPLASNSPANVPDYWLNVAVLLAVCVTVCAGIGWLTGYALKRIRHG